MLLRTILFSYKLFEGKWNSLFFFLEEKWSRPLFTPRARSDGSIRVVHTVHGRS